MTIERLLDLPKGSARRRRLIVLAVSPRRVIGTGLQRGDRLIVEPGSRATSGYLLACQSRGGIVLRRLRLRPRGGPLLTPPDEGLLPLDDGEACTVLGTVLAALRVRGTGELSIAFAPRYEFCAAAGSVGLVDATVRRENSSLLQTIVDALESQQTRGFHAARQIEGAKARLRTLGKCLDVVNDARIYGALVREINTTVLRLSRAFALNRLWIPLASDLRHRGAHLPPAREAAETAVANRPDTRTALGNAQRQIFRS